MMKSKIFLYLLTIGSLLACENNDEKTKEVTLKKLPVITLPTKTITAYTQYPASIKGVINSEVHAKISGYIKEVLVDEGEEVKKGQTLFVLETKSLNEDAAGAKANVKAAQVEVDKLIPLVNKNIISDVQLKTAKAQLEVAKDAYNSIHENIAYGSVKSPVNGYVGKIRLRNGTLVGPSNGIPLTTISQTSKVYAFFSLNEKAYLDFMLNTPGKDINEKIKNLPKVLLELANDSIYNQKGTIETINSQVDENTGTISFRAVFDNPQRILANGNSGNIRIPKNFKSTVVVPKESTYEQQGETYVYKIKKDSTVVLTKINIATDIENMYVINNGVKEGEKIIGLGVDRLRPNQKVIPVATSFDSIAKPIKKSFR